MGEEFYPPNGKKLSPKFEKSEIRNFRKQNKFSPKIKFGGYGSNIIKREQSKMTAKPVKYIVPDICSREAKKGKVRKTDGWEIRNILLKNL